MTKGFMRWSARLAAALVILYGAVLLWVYSVSRDDQSRAADAIVVLGAAQYNGRPSPVLKARLEHALDLYRQGLGRWLVVTGGTRQGDAESEAAVQRRFLLERSVPDSIVVPLDHGRTTEESMAAVAGWMRTRHIATVLLVSDGFHLARLRLEAQRNRIQAFTSPTARSPIEVGSRREWMFLAREALKVPVIWVWAQASPSRT